MGVDVFRESQYLQAATELTICSYYSKNFTDSFRYEDKVNPPKDVDCSFQTNKYKFNIEIKCPDYKKQQNIDKYKGIQLGSIGRYDDFYSLKDKLEAILASPQEPIVLQHNMDNKLKDYLISAHEKFSYPSEIDQLNILVVCCDSPQDIQKWYGYMFASSGLFTEYSFTDPKNYNLVDCVVISNIYHRHYDYINKSKIKNHWDWGHAFNLIFLNPFRTLEKLEPIRLFADITPNFSKEFFDYEGPIDSEGNIHPDIKIPYLVDIIEKEKKYFYFQPSKVVTS